MHCLIPKRFCRYLSPHPHFFLLESKSKCPCWNLRIWQDRKVPLVERLCCMSGEDEAGCYPGRHTEVLIKPGPCLGESTTALQFFQSCHGLWLVDTPQSNWVNLAGWWRTAIVLSFISEKLKILSWGEKISPPPLLHTKVCSDSLRAFHHVLYPSHIHNMQLLNKLIFFKNMHWIL